MPEIFTAKVRDLSHKGLGVVDHPDGRVFFVRGAWPGDEGKFLAAKEAATYSEARLEELVVYSPDRVPVACPHRGTEAGKCGGCPWMIASYESQLRFKQKRLMHALEKRRVRFETVSPIVPSPQTFGYRNRVQLKTNGVVVGYVSEGSRTLAPVDDCLILNDQLRERFQRLKNSLPDEALKPGQGHAWNFIDLDDECGEKLEVNKRRPFRQGNTHQNRVMQEWVRTKFEDLPRHWPVIDLFCGSGNFTAVLSEMGFENILAVEVQGSALEELKKKNLAGVRVLSLDMNKKGVWAQIARVQPHAKAILLDPPREGLLKRRGLFKYLDNLQHVFYISCELDTYARDVADLVSHGWRPVELSPIDLFPHTPHVEMLSSLTRKLLPE